MLAPASSTSTSLPAQARLFLRKVMSMRPLGINDTESIMQFAPLGALTCLCNGRHNTKTDADRRDVCRGCGCLAVATAGDLLDREASQGEIRAMVESLQQAGIRARGLEIPQTIRSLDELNRYLDEYRGKKGRKPPRRPNAPVATARATTR